MLLQHENNKLIHTMAFPLTKINPTGRPRAFSQILPHRLNNRPANQLYNVQTFFFCFNNWAKAIFVAFIFPTVVTFLKFVSPMSSHGSLTQQLDIQ